MPTTTKEEVTAAPTPSLVVVLPFLQTSPSVTLNAARINSKPVKPQPARRTSPRTANITKEEVLVVESRQNRPESLSHRTPRRTREECGA